MGHPDALEAMLSRLSAMRGVDRDFVLERLGPEGAARLLPLLEQYSKAQISDGLRAAIMLAEHDDVPANMTRRGAAALRRAAQETGPAPGAAVEGKAATNQHSMFGRGLVWLGLGG